VATKVANSYASQNLATFVSTPFNMATYWAKVAKHLAMVPRRWPPPHEGGQLFGSDTTITRKMIILSYRGGVVYYH